MNSVLRTLGLMGEAERRQRKAEAERVRGVLWRATEKFFRGEYMLEKHATEWIDVGGEG